MAFVEAERWLQNDNIHILIREMQECGFVCHIICPDKLVARIFVEAAKWLQNDDSHAYLGNECRW